MAHGIEHPQRSSTCAELCTLKHKEAPSARHHFAQPSRGTSVRVVSSCIQQKQKSAMSGLRVPRSNAAGFCRADDHATGVTGNFSKTSSVPVKLSAKSTYISATICKVAKKEPRTVNVYSAHLLLHSSASLPLPVPLGCSAGASGDGLTSSSLGRAKRNHVGKGVHTVERKLL